ncbi:hypothetical protein NQ315_012931 [Exocentrus adspersus]|uniref:Reverse transcriptase domain-containing protein n=1 Tax=Exocentrus adspersus TaxID=1586481 RepID=A0AAV8VRI2_9CUCU|nr:hypothetical protein NQ315_012931 [Exocentrus adspersus]
MPKYSSTSDSSSEESSTSRKRGKRDRKYEKLAKKYRKMKHSRRAQNQSSGSDSESDRSIGTLHDAMDGSTSHRLPDDQTNGEVIEEVPHNEADAELAELLGEKPKEEAPTGPEIHPEIQCRWTNYIAKGLLKDDKSKIIDKYPLASNCPALKPPNLNPEVETILNGAILRQDKFLYQLQRQLAGGLSAISTPLNKLISDKTEAKNKKEELQQLADASKMIAGAIHSLSLHRRYLITPSLNSACRKLVENTPVGISLYDTNLQDSLKAAQAVKRKPQGFKLPALCSEKSVQTEVPDDKGRKETEGPPTNPHTALEMSEVRKRYAGTLKLFAHNWKQINVCSPVINWIKGYKIQFNKKPRGGRHKTQTIKTAELPRYNRAITELLNIGAVEKCYATKGEFLSPYFLRKKPNGKYRFILNLKELNKNITAPHFKLEDYRTAQKIITQNSFLATIDLKDAYFLVPIHTKHKKYLRFKFQEQLYQFTCLPFGLCTAPYIFTKILKPVVKQLRLEGLKTVVYLDDWLIIGQSIQECKNSVNKTVKILEHLGFIINKEKSKLTPSQERTFLGFRYNTSKMTISLPKDKEIKLSKLISKYNLKKNYRIREFAHFLGNLVAACPAIQYGWLHIKSFENQKCLALYRNKQNYDALMTTSEKMKEDILWWSQNIKNSGQKFGGKQFVTEIFSDASLTGWGAICKSNRARGFWNHEEKNLHINVLELKAAYYGLKSLGKNFSHCDILLRIDNVTAISCINKMGSVKYDQLNKLSKKIWAWCEKRNIYVHASYIKSSNNIADLESRRHSIGTEYELSERAFHEIQVQKVHIVVPEPILCFIDAFTVNWEKFYFYAFPPFSLVARVLEKIIHDNACGIVVVPYWPSQPWYPVFVNLLIEKPILLQPKKDLLLSPFRDPHPLWRQISLVVGKLSGAPNSIEIIISSLASSTLKQYSNTYAKWWNYCKNRNQSIYTYNLDLLLEFLREQLSLGAAYSTINSHKAALSLILNIKTDEERIIKRFLKGTFNIRPTTPKYAATWDPDPVLEYLSGMYPLEDLTLEKLTIKLVTLIALVTAHRAQTISKISPDNILKFQDRIEIRIPEKNQNDGTKQISA